MNTATKTVIITGRRRLRRGDTGRPEMAAHAAEALAALWTAGLIGMPNPGVTTPLDPLPLMVGGSSVRGNVQGDAILQLFIPRLIERDVPRGSVPVRPARALLRLRPD